MRVVIVEDEIPARRLLTSMVKQLRPDWEIVASFDSVEDTVKWLREEPAPDLLFLDIELSDGLSFQVLEKVQVESMVIFTTAYDEYALQAFKVNSVDYLLKPIKTADLERAIEKFERLSRHHLEEMNRAIDFRGLAQAMRGEQPQYRKRFLISAGDVFIKLPVEEVAYFFSSQKVTFAVTFKGVRHIVDVTLEKLEEQLDPDCFYRANRQVILHIDSITRIETWFHGKLAVKTNPPYPEQILVSRDKAAGFKRWLDR